MKEQCFDEGTMQAFLDGELSTRLLEQVACHVALCDSCSALLQETESESAFAFAALDNEFNALVPTERIRTNLYQAISEIEKPKTSIWEKFLSLGAIFSGPSMAAFASLAIVATVSIALWSFKNQPTPSNDVAGNSNPTRVIEKVNETVATPVNDSTAVAKNNGPEIKQPVQTTEYQPKPKNSVKLIDANYKLPNTNSNVRRNKAGELNAAPQSDETISGEETYIKTIATLSETVNGQKDQILRPSARVSFEKDLAIADDTITKMKKAVKRNPKNEAAKQVLRNSYQNKIDLLNSVTEKSELMATLKD